MIELLQANWPIVLIALLIGLAIAWLVFRAPRTTRIAREQDDATAASSPAPARRNQALIDAPPTSDSGPAVEPTAAPAALGGTGVAVGAATIDAEREPEARTAEPEPRAEPIPQAASAAGTEASDDLTRIKGVGPKLAAMLRDLNISSFAQIAAWSEAEIERVDAQLGRFQGRIRRDDWVEQARLLQAGDTASYENRFGKL